MVDPFDLYRVIAKPSSEERVFFSEHYNSNTIAGFKRAKFKFAELIVRFSIITYQASGMIKWP
jgi:hypothetical protein